MMKITMPTPQQECHLDELGYCFVRKCIETIEARGLDETGLYRTGGVTSKVARLLQLCLDRKNYNSTTGRVTMPDFSDPVEWETKTITSALKNYLRNLSEPLLTYSLHSFIIEAAKIENTQERADRLRTLIQQLPVENFNLLKTLVEHLRNVASQAHKNRMTVSNLGICFAPTLMRGPEENALMEVKYSNAVAMTLIEFYDSIFTDPRMSQKLKPTTHHHQRSRLESAQHIANSENIGIPYTNHNMINPYNNNNTTQSTITMYNHQNMMNPYMYYNYPNYRSPYTSGKVISLYACIADNESELSFGPNEIITDVQYSVEAGWLVGTLERTGQRGLLPENYVHFV